MTKDAETYRKLTEKVMELTAARGVSISPDTEVFRDLGIYGTELLELFLWINREFGIELKVDLSMYAPGESQFGGLFQRIWIRLTGKQPHYRSLSVGRIVEAIEDRQWKNE
ncbi:MAG: hypothetical protein K2Y40_03805 [Reyranella sp.]|jgi:hypothetical protein|nr:hypothetical protein [Reyranella sp.]